MSSQEELWAGKFGDEYHKRNTIKDRIVFWADVLGSVHTKEVLSVLEVGAGKGENLQALDMVLPYADAFIGVEINKEACSLMNGLRIVGVNSSALDFNPHVLSDLVVTRGFLMHVPDADLSQTLDRIYNWSKRYIILAEYYSPVRREVEYHGHTNALWIDDFAGKMLERYPDLVLLDYGFKYHRDGFGDETFFVMEKKQ